MASTSNSPATVELNIDGYNFANSGKQTLKIYINNAVLTTKTKSADLSNLFTDLYTEYKGDTLHTKFVETTGKLDEIKFITNPTSSTGSYAVRIQLQIVKNPKVTASANKIAANEALIIEFDPYVIDKLPSLSKGGGRRRTKMSKRDPMYRTRKNKK